MEAFIYIIIHRGTHIVFVRVRLFHSLHRHQMWCEVMHVGGLCVFGFSTKPILLFQTTSTQTPLHDEVTAFTAKQWTEHSRNVGSETEVTIAWGSGESPSSFFDTIDEDKTLSAAFLWLSGHEFENQRQFIDVSVFFEHKSFLFSALLWWIFSSAQFI